MKSARRAGRHAQIIAVLISIKDHIVGRTLSKVGSVDFSNWARYLRRTIEVTQALGTDVSDCLCVVRGKGYGHTTQAKHKQNVNLLFLTHFELQEFWDGQSENDDVKAYTNSAGGVSEKVDVDAFCIGYGSVPCCSYFRVCQFR